MLRTDLSDLGFTVAGRDFSETVPSGQVLRQTPGAGDRALSDETVAVVISRGPERYLVPEVSGLEQDAATGPRSCGSTRAWRSRGAPLAGAQAFEVGLEPSAMSDEEEARAARLESERYGRESWTRER